MPLSQRISASLFLVLCFAPGLWGQAGSPTSTAARSKTSAAVIKSVRVVQDTDGPAIEINATRPIKPEIAKIENPPRLVIDLPNAIVTKRPQRIPVQGQQAAMVRIDQFQSNPPIARIVVDLLQPVTWHVNGPGNQIWVRLSMGEEAPKAASAPGLTEKPQPVAVPVNTGSNGLTIETGSRVAAGSTLVAGEETAILQLARGGEVRVCPGTTLSVTSSQSGKDLMLGMSTGAMEAHYSLDSSADSILTPDFRILLAGPGEFHYAMSVDSRGNTCVRSLPGNTSPAIVSELMGDGTYQVKPSEQVVFRSGQIAVHDANVPLFCGCPPPRPEVLRTANPEPSVMPEANIPTTLNLGQSHSVSNAQPPAQTDVPAQGDGTRVTAETSSPPVTRSNDVRVQFEAPLVFRAPSQPEPAPIQEVAQLSNSFAGRPEAPPAMVLPPPSNAKPERKGFFGKLKGFFSGMFH